MIRPDGCAGSILSRAHSGVDRPFEREHVDAACEREVDVFLAPHHALGHAGGATRVEQVDVVVGALVEVALGRVRRERGLVLDGLELGIVGVGVVPLDADERLSFGCAARAAMIRGAYSRWYTSATMSELSRR